MNKRSLSEVFQHYIQRYPYMESFQIDSIEGGQADLRIVIPCYNEPDLTGTLNSLLACEPPTLEIEVIIVLNQRISEGSIVRQQNEMTRKEFNDWKKRSFADHFTFHVLEAFDLPDKNAGVGLARKIGMDEALRRFSRAGINGHIICLDADCRVSSNYLIELEKVLNPGVRGAHVSFAHPYKREMDEVLRAGIVNYELHLRYHNSGLRYTGFSSALHTIGSCMIVRSDVYALVGGMNRRKAGEDFYFMHKIYPGGDIKIIPDAKVFPSCRISDRVPFGTGRFQGKWRDSSLREMESYHPETYEILKVFFDEILTEYGSEINLYPVELRPFLLKNKFEERWIETRNRSRSEGSFASNIRQWVDGFMILKMVHYLRDEHLGERDLITGANQLLQKLSDRSSFISDKEELLEAYRTFEGY